MKKKIIILKFYNLKWDGTKEQIYKLLITLRYNVKIYFSFMREYM